MKRKNPFITLLLPLLILLGFGGALHAQIPRVIFDSDMSSDWDDVGDAAVLHGLASLGECEIIGMMASSTNGGTPLCMDAINTYYGKPNIPIGRRPDQGGIGLYPGQIAAEFPHGPETVPGDFPLAVPLYRQLLAASPDNSVVIVTAGYLNNVHGLLLSGPDAHSSLSGPALVAQKVKLLACVGGQYPSGNEFNFRVEPTAASYVVNNWPSRVTYTGFEMGNQIRTAGRIDETPTNNPIRRVYVDIKNNYPYPSWTQIGMVQAIRSASSPMWGVNNVGRNNADPEAYNFWTATPDLSGNQDQAYLLEKMRFPVIEELDALMNLAPNNGSPSLPGWPSHLRATAVSGSQINLQWTDNSFNESGFRIERRVNGVYTQIASVGANVTSYSVTGLSSTANQSFRVKSWNATGESSATQVQVYTGWTEINFAGTGTSPSLYSNYQNNLRWNRGGDFRPDHVILNNDSSHGQTLTVDVNVSALGAQGSFYIYFFYQDANNWYRLNASENACKFEKRVGGTITQIGAAGSFSNIGNGSGPDKWKLEVNSSGNLKFTREMPFTAAPELQHHVFGTLLNVTEPLVFSTGLIGLGGNARTPVWENFVFATTGGGGGSAPSAPTGLAATAGNAQVTLNWTASSGATSYEIYRATSSNGQGSTPIATGVTGTSYVNTGLTNGTAYYYKVKAVNANGVSGFSNEANATPTGGGGSPPSAPTGLAATAGNAQITLNWTASSGATSYEVYRATTSNGQGSTPIATGVTGTSYVNTGLTNGTAYYYKLKAVNANGASALSSEASATPTGGGGGGSAQFVNGSFETPTLSGYSYNPSGSNWTFTNNAGIQRNGSAYSGGDHVAPDGVQTALLQGVGGNLGTMSQSVNFTAGSYTISFQASRRWGSIQPVRVTVGGTVIGTFTPGSSGFQQFTTSSFTVTAGNHTVTFAATDNVGDKTSLVDQVVITGGSGGGGSPPAAPAGLGATAGNAQVSLAWTASSGATSYEVFRSTTSNGQGSTPIATGITGTSYVNTGLTNSTAYFYKVKAVNTHGTSGFSNEASATPTSGGGGGGTPLGGSLIGTSGSYGGSQWTADKVFDGNLGTFFDAPTASGSWAGLDLGTAQVITQIAYCPRQTFGSRMVGGLFQGANSSDFSGAVTLYTVASAPADGVLTTQNVSNGTAFRYVRYIGAANQYCNIAEAAFYGTSGGGGGSAPSAPTGLSANAGNTQVSLSWTASSGATSYNVYRGTSSNGQSGTPVATGVTATSYVNTGLTNGTTYYYKVRAVNTHGTSGDSGEASATPTAGGGGSASFLNAGFETPAISGYTYSSAGTSWTFTNNAGIQRNGSAYSGTTHVAPEGVQTALLQSAGGNLGTMSQNLTLNAGVYSISFQACRRWGSIQPVSVTVNGTSIGTFTPSGNSFQQFITDEFVVAADTYTVTFAATDSVGDKATLIDSVAVTVE